MSSLAEVIGNHENNLLGHQRITICSCYPRSVSCTHTICAVTGLLCDSEVLLMRRISMTSCHTLFLSSTKVLMWWTLTSVSV